MKFELDFLEDALQEAELSTTYYEGRLPGLGIRFRQELECVCSAIVRQPLLWRERDTAFRRVNLPGFPCFIAYFIRSEKIVVAAVGHASRHPEYWKKRLEKDA